MTKRQNMLIPQTTHVLSTLVVMTTVAFVLLATTTGWSTGAPAVDPHPAAVVESSRTRRSSELAYGEGEPVQNGLDKRIGQLASWGKRNDMSWLDRAASKAIRSKWSNSNMAVWGKRSQDDKRGKWSGNNMAVWG